MEQVLNTMVYFDQNINHNNNPLILSAEVDFQAGIEHNINIFVDYYCIW